MKQINLLRYFPLLILCVVMIVSLFSCNENDTKPLFVVKSTLTGDWKFKSTSLEGEFTLKDSTVTKGYYNPGTIEFELTNKTKLGKTYIMLYSNNNYVYLYDVVYKTNEITAQGFQMFIQPNFNYSKGELITIKKQ